MHISASRSPLYPYGIRAGDIAAQKVDDACNVEYQQNIAMFGKNFSRLYVSFLTLEIQLWKMSNHRVIKERCELYPFSKFLIKQVSILRINFVHICYVGTIRAVFSIFYFAGLYKRSHLSG